MSEVKEKEVWQSLMNEAYGRWKEHENWSYEEMLDACTPAERIAVLLGNLNYQVENGGFQQWVDNGYALHGGEIVSILMELPEWVPYAEDLASKIDDLLDYVDLTLKNRGWDNYWKKATSPFGDPIDWNEGPQTAKSMDHWYYEEVQPEFLPAVEKWLGENKDMKLRW